MLNTAIEWAHHTVNFWWGCSKVSPACANCYAESIATRFRAKEVQWGEGGGRWIRPKAFTEAAKIERISLAAGGGQRVFVNSMSDTFEAHGALITQRAMMLNLLANSPGANWLLLTKRPENIAAMVPPHWMKDWPAHVWIGTTVENQDQAALRIPPLVAIPAAIHFLSCEPLLGPIDLCKHGGPLISWVIAGGESGPKARPMRYEWIKSLADQCHAGGERFFFKQWGEYDEDGYRPGKKAAGRLLDGREWNEVPA